MKEGDRPLFDLVEGFWPDYLTFNAHIVPARSTGTFSIASRRGSIEYTLKSRYLVNITLTGDKDTGIRGNDQDNRLTGNEGDNRIEGGAGRRRDRRRRRGSTRRPTRVTPPSIGSRRARRERPLPTRWPIVTEPTG